MSHNSEVIYILDSDNGIGDLFKTHEHALLVYC